MKIRYNAPVTLTMALLCCAAMGAHQLTNGATTQTFFTAYPGLHGSSPLHYVQFFTYIFGHGSFSHLSANLSLLLLIGQINEEKFGSGLMFEMILVTALLTALLNAVFFNGLHVGVGEGGYRLLIHAEGAPPTATAAQPASR